MSFQPGAVLNTQGFGNRPENVEVPVIESRDPAPSDSNPSLYPIGKRWINTVNGSEWSLVGSTSSSGVTTAAWTILGGGGGAIATINSQPPIAGNFNILGTLGQINVLSVAGSSTLSLAGPYTPFSYTAHAVLLGEGASSIGTAGPGASGEALMGNTGLDPSFTGSPSFSGSVTAATTITATAGDITASAGNIFATLGDIVASGGDVFAQIDITAATGDITASAGNIISTLAGVSAGTTVTGGTGVSATTGNVTAAAGDLTAVLGNLVLQGAASGIQINAGTPASATIGTATLGAGGTVIVATSSVTAASKIFLSYETCTSALAAALDAPSASIIPNTSFVINSQDATDATSTVNWWIIN